MGNGASLAPAGNEAEGSVQVTPEVWQRVKEVLAGALEREPMERPAYLDHACTEESLRKEVESLIAAHEQSDGGLMERPPAESGALKTGTKLGSYEILAFLGAGGMGEVYQAHDCKLGRNVAVKVLPAAFVHDADRLSRFQREARMLASLNHPNIAAIYGLEQSDEVQYLVMELVPGQTLAERLSTNPLSIEESLAISRQIAEALQAAHEKGVIHRDLKPANVKVTPEGRVKVLDFGLAKAFTGDGGPHPSQAPTVTGMGTQEGAILGTPAYMSPEQVRGRPVDKRTDIWAFGCVLYELLTGRKAFPGETLADTIAAILEREPDWLALPPSTPTEIRDLLQQSLQKSQPRRLDDISKARIEMEKVQRYGLTAELLANLRTVRHDQPSSIPTPAPTVAGRRVRNLAVALLAVIVLAAGAVIIPPWRERMRGSPGIEPIPRERQLAVLPFEVVGADPSAKAFSDGLTETLTAKLAQLTTRHDLQVVPASEVRNRKVASSESARAELGVNLILTGSLQQTGGMARVTYELVDTRSHRQLRADTITIAAADPFAGEDQVVDSVLRMLELELQPAERQNLGTHGTQVADAYDFYLQGRGYLQNYDKVENLQNAIAAFQRALTTDPNYALAYAGLGQTYWMKYRESKETQWVDPARQACEHALALDTRLAVAHVCLGAIASGTGQYEKAVKEFAMAGETEPTTDDAYRGLGEAYQNLGNLAEAEKTYRRAIALRPHYWAPYNWLGVFYFQQARFAEAVAMFNQVVALVPDSFRGYSNLGAALNGEGHYREAIEANQHSIAIRPTDSAYTNLGNAYFFLRQYHEAVLAQQQAVKLKEPDYLLWYNLGEAYFWDPGERAQAPAAYRKAISLALERLRVNPKDLGAMGDVSICYAMLGERSSAMEYLRQGLHSAPRDPRMLFSAALVYNQFGEVNLTLKWLAEALAAGYSRTIVRDTPNFDPLRPNFRFQELLRAK
jgi:serine/threonine-protein kinase